MASLFRFRYLVNGATWGLVGTALLDNRQRRAEEPGARVIAARPEDEAAAAAIEGPQQPLETSNVYRMFSTVLAEKLNATNQKAKHFELLNMRLFSRPKAYPMV